MNNICYGVDMSKEVWRTKPEWKGYYEFSNWGRCRSLDRVVPHSIKGTQLIKGKEKSISNNGRVQFYINGEQYNLNVAEVIAELFIPQYTPGMPINMIDGNKANCRLDNIQITLCPIKTTFKYSRNIWLKIQNANIEDIPIIEGGFGEKQRVLFDITLANKIGKPVAELRTVNIIPNLSNWIEGTDYIDLLKYKNVDDYLSILLKLGFTTRAMIRSEHIYVFSERGVAKLMSSLHNSNPVKWEFLNNFVNEYFEMREQINEGYRPSNYLEALKQLVIEVEAKEKAQREAEEAKLLADSLKDENTVIKEKLNKMGIKPPYTVSSIQSATKATRTAVVQYMLDNNWVIRKIKEGKPRGFIVVNEDYVAQANGDKVWGIHLTAKGTWHLLEVFNHKQNKLF